MHELVTDSTLAEDEFAALVDSVAADGDRRDGLTSFLREDHPFYDQRGTAATVRMRGWVLLALARHELPETALVFVLEELDTGIDAYLVAAAARALRAYPVPETSFGPLVVRAIQHIQYYEEPVSFDGYGEYAESVEGPSPLRELFATLVWLGPAARNELAALESFRETCERIPSRLLPELDRAIKAVRGTAVCEKFEPDACCALPAGLTNIFSWGRSKRDSAEPVGRTMFEDQDGASITFDDFFCGQPSIVVFFYTRCDNPHKCSLTVSKLAQVQKLLRARELAAEIRTAAITYDPDFDDPVRLRRYAHNRGVQANASHRMLRSKNGIDLLREHFGLGVNFIDSLVNRHRIEAYVLDHKGRVATRFERLHWSEGQVVDRAIEVLNESREPTLGETAAASNPQPPRRIVASPIFGTLTSIGVAFFPKCPFCWAAYFSFFGIAGLEQFRYSPWLYWVLLSLLLINLGSVWLRSSQTRRMGGFFLAAAGALVLIASKISPSLEKIALVGVLLTVAGSIISAFPGRLSDPKRVKFGRPRWARLRWSQSKNPDTSSN